MEVENPMIQGRYSNRIHSVIVLTEENNPILVDNVGFVPLSRRAEAVIQAGIRNIDNCYTDVNYDVDDSDFDDVDVRNEIEDLSEISEVQRRIKNQSTSSKTSALRSNTDVTLVESVTDKVDDKSSTNLKQEPTDKPIGSKE